MLKEKPSEFDVSKEILGLFYSNKEKNNKVKQELKLDVTFDIDDDISFNIAIGLKKIYN